MSNQTFNQDDDSFMDEFFDFDAYYADPNPAYPPRTATSQATTPLPTGAQSASPDIAFVHASLEAPRILAPSAHIANLSSGSFSSSHNASDTQSRLDEAIPAPEGEPAIPPVQSSTLLPEYRTDTNINGVTTLMNTKLNPGQVQLSGNPSIDGFPRFASISVPVVKDKRTRASANSDSIIENEDENSPRQIESYNHSLPPYLGTYTPTQITAEMWNVRGGTNYFPKDRGLPPILPYGTRYSAKLWANAYNAAHTRVSKYYTAQGCHPMETAELLTLDRKSGLMRWITIKWLVKDGLLPGDFVEDMATI